MAHVEAQRFLCHYKGFYDFIYFLKLHQNRVVLCGDWYRCMWPLLTSLLLSQFYYRILTLVWHYTIWCLNLLKAIWSRLWFTIYFRCLFHTMFQQGICDDQPKFKCQLSNYRRDTQQLICLCYKARVMIFSYIFRFRPKYR